MNYGHYNLSFWRCWRWHSEVCLGMMILGTIIYVRRVKKSQTSTYFCVTPSANSDTSTIWHPFAVLVSWHGDWWDTRSGQVEGWTEFEDTDIIGLSSVVILWMVDPSSNWFLLLGWLVLFDIMSTTNSGDTIAFAVSSRDNTVGTDDGTTTEVRTTSLERNNVWFRTSGWDWSTDNLK